MYRAVTVIFVSMLTVLTVILQTGVHVSMGHNAQTFIVQQIIHVLARINADMGVDVKHPAVPFSIRIGILMINDHEKIDLFRLFDCATMIPLR